MTTTTQRMELISAEAKAYSPPKLGRVLATMVTAIFVALGWLIGATWYAGTFAFAATRYGFRQGAHLQRTPAQASGQETARG